MHKLTFVIVFTLGAIGIAFAQAPAGEDHLAHHPAQESAAPPPNSPAPPPGATGAQPPAMMQGMMQMMQGMQTMMQTIHQPNPPDQKPTAQAPAMQDCRMMPRGGGAATDLASMQAMMRMMQDMMRMMQSQMTPAQMPREPQ